MATRRLRYLPAIDGLRALAVGAVIAFHLAPDAVPGGFLGVDTFFVVSGYLITSLLLAEHRDTGRIALRDFWARRARRLLPALLVLLVAVAAAVGAWWPAEDLARIRGDALGGLGYVANWRFIASGDSYFDLATGPSPLRHLWSLAIEEQFYVVWPLVAAACLRRSPRLLGAVCVAGAVASVLAMAAAGAGDRAYYGTDTRAHALLIGAGLAVALRHDRAAAPRWLPAAGAAAAACVAGWWLAGESSGWLFGGGFAAYAGLTAVVVTAVVRGRDGTLARWLSARPLVAVGKVSYGLYLWHWPAIVLLTPERAGLDGLALDAFRLGVTVAGTLASYGLIEQPVRFGRAFRGRVAAALTPAAVAATAVAVAVATSGAAPVPDYFRTPDEGPVVAAVSVNTPVEVEVAAGVVAPAPHEPRSPTAVVLVGDSVAWTFHEELGAALAARGIAFASAAVIGCGAAAGIAPGMGTAADHEGHPVAWGYTCRHTVLRLQEEAMAAVPPDLVLFHSTWETADRDVGGRLIRFGTAAWDEHVRAELHHAVERLAAGGARVAFTTVPATVAGELQQAAPGENARRARFNELLREIAAGDPKRVVLVDLAPVVCGGSAADCQPVVDGIRLRPLDGNHFEDEGAAWVAERLAGLVAGLDLAAAGTRPS